MTFIEGLDLAVNEGIIKSYTIDNQDNVIIAPNKDKVVYITGMIIKDIKPIDIINKSYKYISYSKDIIK